MTFVAYDKDGTEWIYDSEPIRNRTLEEWEPVDYHPKCVELPPGSIRKLIGRDLTWEDEPVELT